VTVPPGTPNAHLLESAAAPLWCTHGVRWDPEQDGYRPTHVDAAHHDRVHRGGSGAIPETCHPVTAYDPAEYPNAGPAAVARVLDETPGARPTDYPQEQQ
jgi:hypothetical protein